MPVEKLNMVLEAFTFARLVSLPRWADLEDFASARCLKRLLCPPLFKRERTFYAYRTTASGRESDMNTSNDDGMALRTVGSLLLSLFALAAFWPRPSLAGGVVGTGSAASCTEAALDAALAGGGIVTFNCGPAPATITVTSTKMIDADTAIDGGSVVTISGGGQVRIFIVDPQVTLALDHITISRGAGMYSGGAIVNSGTLKASNSIFSRNKVTVLDSPSSFGGGAIFNYLGTMRVANSTFSRNRSSGSGGGPNDGGGAISNYGAANSMQTITNCRFFRNKSGENNGGAITNFNPLVSDASNGLTVISSSFFGNHVGFGGEGDGGAIYNNGGLTVTSSTFATNRSANNGGAIASELFGSPLLNSTLTVTNSTFVGNKAYLQGSSGGAIYFQSETKTSAIINSTFSRNKGGCGDCGGAVDNNGATPLTITNTLLTRNHGGNCVGFGHIIDGGHNLRWPSTDMSCVGTFAAPRLVKLADNGGPTRTMALCTGL
jgi:hypothetical protein